MIKALEKSKTETTDGQSDSIEQGVRWETPKGRMDDLEYR